MSSQQPEELQQITPNIPSQNSQQTNAVCQKCNTFFKKVSHFHRHLRQRHSQARDFTCTEQGCAKSFKRGSHLKRHMISHTNIKPFDCIYCIMKFGYKHHLDRHIKTVHLSERIECTQCNLKFNKKRSYTKHIEDFHTLKTEEIRKRKSCDNSKISKTDIDKQKVDDDVFDSNNDSKSAQQQLYRCQLPNCMSAFLRLPDFKRHLVKIHSEKECQK